MSSLVVNSSPFYSSVSLPDSLNYAECRHATHCMLYSEPNPHRITYVLLQMRFDGLFGFVGGGVDVEDVTTDHIIDAMNRELEEEINYSFESLTQKEWICSHRDRDLMLHFFAKQLSFEELLQIGKTHVNAHHFPAESLGLIYVPINGFDAKSSTLSHQFLNNLFRQKFAGNGKQQFIESVRKRNLLTEEQILELEVISKCESLDSSVVNNYQNGREVKAMPTINTGFEYYNERVDVTYGLMIIRGNGLIDFVGTDLVDTEDKDLMIETLSRGLQKDLGSYCQSIVSKSDSIEYSFDSDLSHIFWTQLNSSQFTRIETNFTETENFNQSSFGIFRVPFQLRGHTIKAENYVKRFLNGFLNQNFVNNSKNHLKSIYEKMLTQNTWQ